MILIAHRINRLKELKSIPIKYGIELDIRDYQKHLILQHDPFKKGEKFKNLIDNFKHRFIILNIKSENIEFEVLKLLKKKKLSNYFFLDSSFPMIRNLIKKKENRIACRVSDYEDIQTSINLKKKIKWIWFETRKPLRKSFSKLKKLKSNKFKICLVSPDLHKKRLKLYKKDINYIKKHKLVDAVCSKFKNFKYWI